VCCKLLKKKQKIKIRFSFPTLSDKIRRCLYVYNMYMIYNIFHIYMYDGVTEWKVSNRYCIRCDCGCRVEDLISALTVSRKVPEQLFSTNGNSSTHTRIIHTHTHTHSHRYILYTRLCNYVKARVYIPVKWEP